jgi:hypothetical protein
MRYASNISLYLNFWLKTSVIAEKTTQISPAEI